MFNKINNFIRKILPENIKTEIHLKENEDSGYSYCGLPAEEIYAFIIGKWQLPPQFICDPCFDTDEIELTTLIVKK